MKYFADKITANGMSKGCLTKKRFSEKTAIKIAKKFEQRPYYCSLCFTWHLTSKVKNG